MESMAARIPTPIRVFSRVALIVAAMALLGVMATASGATEEAQANPVKPNFVFILADDMRKDDLRYMPKTRALLGDKGMRFTGAYISLAQCCPSRATIMRGQYAHNTGVWDNADSPQGGWQGYQTHGNEQDNLATNLHDAGYRTALLGKYLNHYKGTFVPPGWSRWFAAFDPNAVGTQPSYYDYRVNDNGTIRRFGATEQDYQTDVIRDETEKFIGARVNQRKPFFAYVTPVAPHGPPIPAPRHRHALDGEQAPRLPSFNEKDILDKPPWIRKRRPLGEAEIAKIDTYHEKRAETLLALDDLVEGVVDKLRSERVLSNTYVVFTSDNGWQEGEHRIRAKKGQPYEESVHMPLLVRGPGVQAGSVTKELTVNTDFFPTFTDLAGIQTPEYVDGRSLRPLLKGNAATWRDAILLERRNPRIPGASFYGIRTSEGIKYLEYEGGFRELYDLRTDPYELDNSYDAAAPPADLSTRLQVLKGCGGAECQAAEDGP